MSSALLESVIASLMPHFIAAARNPDDARNEIIDTLADYATRTRAELLHAAHIIAFSMSTLETLAQATARGLSASMRLRHQSCANGLARAMHQSEQALARRLEDESPASPEPTAPVSEPRGREERRRKAPAAARVPTTGWSADNAASPQSHEEHAQQHWAGALMAALR